MGNNDWKKVTSLILFLGVVVWGFSNWTSSREEKLQERYNLGYSQGQLDPLYPEDLTKEYVSQDFEKYCGTPARYVPKYAPSQEVAALRQHITSLHSQYGNWDTVKSILIDETYDPRVVNYEVATMASLLKR